MRGALAGLRSPYPIREQLPAVLQEDDLTTRFTAGLDDVLSSVISVLDCLEAYLDPHVAPEDFLVWLGSWLGEVLDENWPLARRRRAVAEAVDLHRLRGTMHGLRLQLELASGRLVELVDSGGVSWSSTPNAELSGPTEPALEVRVVADAADTPALDALIRAAKPAHVKHRLEVRQP